MASGFSTATLGMLASECLGKITPTLEFYTQRSCQILGKTKILSDPAKSPHIISLAVIFFQKPLEDLLSSKRVIQGGIWHRIRKGNPERGAGTARAGPKMGGVGGESPVQSEAGGRSRERPLQSERIDWLV